MNPLEGREKDSLPSLTSLSKHIYNVAENRNFTRCCRKTPYARPGGNAGRVSGEGSLPRSLGTELSLTGTGEEGPQVLAEFLWRNDAYHFIVEFFEVVNVADIPWRDDHSGAKSSVDP